MTIPIRSFQLKQSVTDRAQFALQLLDRLSQLDQPFGQRVQLEAV